MKGKCVVFLVVMAGRISWSPVEYFIKFILETIV